MLFIIWTVNKSLFTFGITKTKKDMTRNQKKAIKAVIFVNQSVNYLNENGVYDFERAKRKAKSYNYHRSKS